MSKSSLFIVLWCFVIVAFAQPVINSTDVLPPLDTTYGNRVFDATSVSPGPAGANQTWDFSFLIPIGSDQTNVVDPAKTPEGSKFTVANIAIGNDSDFVYYKGHAASFDFYGATAEGNTIYYTDPEEHLVFPITYGDTNLDAFDGNADLTIPGLGMLTTFRYGYGRLEADGYGTLKLPTGTFNDVLRVQLVSQQTDSVWLLFFDSIVHTTVVSYQWYQAGTRAPLLSITEVTTDVQPQPIYAGSYLDNNVGISTRGEELIVDMLLAPNMARNETRINYTLSHSAVVEISLVNLLGRVIRQFSGGNRSGGSHIESLSLHGLGSGIYFVKAKLGDQVLTRKLIIP